MQSFSDQQRLPDSARRREKKRSASESTELAIDSDFSSDDLHPEPQSRESAPKGRSGSDTEGSYNKQITGDDGELASDEETDDDRITRSPASDESDPKELDDLLRKYGGASDGSNFAEGDKE
jgi:hypothetical protein